LCDLKVWTSQEFDSFIDEIHALIGTLHESDTQAITQSRHRVHALDLQIQQAQEARRRLVLEPAALPKKPKIPPRKPPEPVQKTEQIPQIAPVLAPVEKTFVVSTANTPVATAGLVSFVEPHSVELRKFDDPAEKTDGRLEKPLAPFQELVHDAGVVRVRPEMTEPVEQPSQHLPPEPRQPTPDDAFASKEAEALYIIDRFKGGQPRKEEFEAHGLGPYDRRNYYIVSLAQRGLLRINKAGAISTTTLGHKTASKRKKTQTAQAFREDNQHAHTEP
jgi:hypothetical protein